MTAKDASGKVIGGTNGDVLSADGDPAILSGVFSDDLKLTDEAHGDYIQFTLGAQAWRSTDPACKVGGFDIKSFASVSYHLLLFQLYQCLLIFAQKTGTAHRDMDCVFQC